MDNQNYETNVNYQASGQIFYIMPDFDALNMGFVCSCPRDTPCQKRVANQLLKHFYLLFGTVHWFKNF